MRTSFVLLSLKQVGCLSGLIIVGPRSKYAYFIYANEDHVEEILGVHQRVPITVRGEPFASNVQTIIQTACPPVLWGTL
jgi:hypothetical protein